MEDSKEASEVNTFAFEQRNTEFLNKEISFFIENLRKVTINRMKLLQKAIDSGLNEDSLMPLQDSRDKQICKRRLSLLVKMST